MRLNDEILNSIIFSIKPNYNKLILNKEKVYEFRNYFPKLFNGYFWVYESTPSKKLIYIMKVSNPIIYPEKIENNSYGTDRFNSGEMKCKYAYRIEEIFLITNPIDLKTLKVYNFHAPQMYMYLNKNRELKKYLSENIKLEKLF